mmetsp:Transcript_6360/g.18698  ORF Transcript_6360/g.18698 Transcript_6360/m.18698 type:complete len:657 (+) Transcript_6360:111-2081(+)
MTNNTAIDDDAARNTLNGQIQAFCVSLIGHLDTSGGGDMNQTGGSAGGTAALRAADVHKFQQQHGISPLDPMDLFAYLIPELFSVTGTTTSAHISPASSLRIITALATLDAKAYVQPAIRTLQTLTSFHTTKQRSSTTQLEVVVPGGSASELSQPPTDLIAVLVNQACCSEQVQVSDAAKQSLLNCVALFPELNAAFLSTLASLWKLQLDAMAQGGGKSTTTTKQQASIIAVRAATLWTESMCADPCGRGLASAFDATCSSFFIRMLQDASDPLLQMSILDLFEKLTGSDQVMTSKACQRWLLSESVLRSIFVFCGVTMATENGEQKTESSMIDPLLGGAALCVLSGLCQVLLLRSQSTMDVDEVDGDGEANIHGNNDVSMTDADSSVAVPISLAVVLAAFSAALHQFAQEDSSLSEAEQLSLWDAISSFAATGMDALRMVLEHRTIRHSWICISASKQPKLKAAQLLSMARVFDPSVIVADDSNGRNSAKSNDSLPTISADRTKLLQQLYAMTLTEQTSASRSATSTTELLLLWAASPIAEIRIACYALLTAYVTACGLTGAQVVLGSKPAPPSGGDDGRDDTANAQKSLEMMDWLLLRGREPTPACRIAKYELTKTIFEKSKGLLAERVQRKLEKFIARGPHYAEAQAWDVAAE